MMVILKLTQEEHRELTRHYFYRGLITGLIFGLTLGSLIGAFAVLVKF